MPFTVQAYPGPLSGLEDSLVAALDGFEDTLGFVAEIGDREMTTIGPFPVYALDPNRLTADASEEWPATAVVSGWRTLVEYADEPLALVEVAHDGDREIYSVRGREAATSFADLLRHALPLIDEGAEFEVRWFTIPDVYVSALWLFGEQSVFLPSRLGDAMRAELQQLSWPELRERVGPLVAAARPVAGLLDRDPGSPRSGLPAQRRDG